MLLTLKNNKSLTYYQQTSLSKLNITAAHSGGSYSVAIANNAIKTVNTTNGFKTQLNGLVSELEAQKNIIAEKVAMKLVENHNYTGMRSDGVSLAWDYEVADIRMGGKGSANWSKIERNEILKNRPETVNKGKIIDGKQQNAKAGVRGAEGHHQKNVANHPEYQADPNNIRFYKNREDHLKQGHKGDFQNETNEPMIDKNDMLVKTNSKRVLKNELKGLGFAIAMGVSVGASIAFIVTLARSGITPETIKLATIEGGKAGLESGVLASVGYGVGRTLGDVINKAMTGTINYLGINITESISKMINIAAVGALTITVFSTYQFMKLKIQGTSMKEALAQVGKQALFSIGILAVSIVAQGLWGGPAGIIVSASIATISTSYIVKSSVSQRKFAEEIRIYMIDKCYPRFDI